MLVSSVSLLSFPRLILDSGPFLLSARESMQLCWNRQQTTERTDTTANMPCPFAATAGGAARLLACSNGVDEWMPTTSEWNCLWAVEGGFKYVGRA